MVLKFYLFILWMLYAKVDHFESSLLGVLGRLLDLTWSLGYSVMSDKYMLEITLNLAVLQ